MAANDKMNSINESFDILKKGFSDFVRKNIYSGFTGFFFLKKSTKQHRDDLVMEYHGYVKLVDEARDLMPDSPAHAISKLKDLSQQFSEAIDRHRAHSKDPLHDKQLPKMHLLKGRIGDTIFGIAPMLPPVSDLT